MRITALLLLFTMFASSDCMPVEIKKESIYIAELEGNAIYLFESEINSKLLDPDSEIKVKELVEIKTLRENCNLYTYFPNKMHAYMHKKGWFTIENLEKFTDKDDSGKIIDQGFIINLLIKGVADFMLEQPIENGFVLVKTEKAELEIKSKRFYIDSLSHLTFVECYDGEIKMTDSISFKETILKKNQKAEIYSTDGNKNTMIKISDLKQEEIALKKERDQKFKSINYIFK